MDNIETNSQEREIKMIQVNISEIKNRLSYYLSRITPLARIIHVSQAETENHETPWIKETERLGIVSPPPKKGFPPELLAKEKLISMGKKGKPAVLKALLEERDTGR